MHLLDVMARTACSGGWLGVAHFGLRDFFTQLKAGRAIQVEAIRIANQALEELGVEWFRIDSIVKDRELPNGAEFTITVSLLGKGPRMLEAVSLGRG